MTPDLIEIASNDPAGFFTVCRPFAIVASYVYQPVYQPDQYLPNMKSGTLCADQILGFLTGNDADVSRRFYTVEYETFHRLDGKAQTEPLTGTWQMTPAGA